MKIIIDRDRCTGHGRCYTLAPDLFEPDDDGYGVAIHDIVPAGREAQAIIGVGNCPEDAITVSEHHEEPTS
jgi:ferredoxin